MEYKSKPRKVRVTTKKAATRITRKPVSVRVIPTRPTIYRNPTPYSDEHKAHLTYYDYNIFSTGASVAGNYVFTANGLFDPNITGTGHQPMAFDQLMLMYNHYTVISSKITVTYVNNSATLPVIVAIYKSNAPTPITDIQQIMENGKITTKNLDPLYTNRSCVLTSAMNISKEMGRPGILTENDFRGSSTANPVEQAYFILSAWNETDSSSIGVQFNALIEYYVIFTEPKKLTLS